MAIDNNQLNTWAKQGATVTAKATHESIRKALSADGSPIKNRISNGTVRVYLQGSYRNWTNIHGDSDVDVVVELESVFSHNAADLPFEQRDLHDRVYSNATYSWSDFREDVIQALQSYYDYGSVDDSGNKSIKLAASSGRLNADVVPVLKHRRYAHFFGRDKFESAFGVKLYHRGTGRSIVNYPHHHRVNGWDKNSDVRTKGLYKPAVRIFKNARSYIIDRGELSSNIAPSYFLEGLLHNAPDYLFVNNDSDTFYNILKYLHTTSISDFMCQNGIHPLFGASDESWNEQDAVHTINKLVELWDNWNRV